MPRVWSRQQRLLAWRRLNDDEFTRGLRALLKQRRGTPTNFLNNNNAELGVSQLGHATQRDRASRQQ